MTSYTFVTNTLHVCIVVLNSLGFFFVVFGAATTVLPFFKKPSIADQKRSFSCEDALGFFNKIK